MTMTDADWPEMAPRWLVPKYHVDECAPESAAEAVADGGEDAKCGVVEVDEGEGSEGLHGKHEHDDVFEFHTVGDPASGEVCEDAYEGHGDENGEALLLGESGFFGEGEDVEGDSGEDKAVESECEAEDPEAVVASGFAEGEMNEFAIFLVFTVL